MHSGGNDVDHELRLIIVDSPDVAAPLIGALDVAAVGAWMWVEAEHALYFSPGVLDLLGIACEPRANLLARFFECVHRDDQEPVRNLLLCVAPAGPFRLRYRFMPPDGPLRWIEDRGRIERDARGVLIRQGGALRDVTHDVGRELERRESDARLEALLNAMPLAVWARSGPDLTVTHQNAVSIAAWGDLRGHGISDAPPELRKAWANQLTEVMSGQVLRARREQVVGSERRTIEDIIAPVVVEDQVTGVVGVAIDVSEEARAGKYQALLTEISADFAGRANEALEDGIVLALEKIGRFLGAPVAVLCEIGDASNPNHVRVTHWWVDPASGQQEPSFIEGDGSNVSGLLARLALNSPVVVASRDDLPAAERTWLAERRVQSFAVVPTRPTDGTHTLLALAGADEQSIDWPPDTVPCMRLAATLLAGVLARSRAEANQRAVERRMQDAQRLESLGVLAGGIAHDFNNLLTAILGNASLLRAEIADVDGAAEAVEQIEAASRRAAELCRQMLAYAGRGRFALQLINLNDLLRDIQPLLAMTTPKNARVELALAPAIPAVFADESQIRQLIMNLVFNAAEALVDGTGTITLRTDVGERTAEQLARTVFSPQLPTGRYASLSIVDTGHGMTAETAARIFDPFFSTRFTGRGLGLAAVVGIVRAHKGALRVESTPGEGSTFELLLPAAEGAPAPPPEAASPASHASAAAWRTTGTALVIDDERGVRDLVRSVLERNGMTVMQADSGERGIELFPQIADEVRIVLIDLTMPGLDGRETLAAIREHRPNVPALLMSGYSPADLMNATSHAFLQKPFTPAALRTVVKRLLDE